MQFLLEPVVTEHFFFLEASNIHKASVDSINIDWFLLYYDPQLMESHQLRGEGGGGYVHTITLLNKPKLRLRLCQAEIQISSDKTSSLYSISLI